MVVGRGGLLVQPDEAGGSALVGKLGDEVARRRSARRGAAVPGARQGVGSAGQVDVTPLHRQLTGPAGYLGGPEGLHPVDGGAGGVIGEAGQVGLRPVAVAHRLPKGRVGPVGVAQQVEVRRLHHQPPQPFVTGAGGLPYPGHPAAAVVPLQDKPVEPPGAAQGSVAESSLAAKAAGEVHVAGGIHGRLLEEAVGRVAREGLRRVPVGGLGAGETDDEQEQGE